MIERITAQLAAEYQALTAAWGVVDVSDRTQVELTGADRVDFLNGFCTNDIKKLAPGSGCEAFLTNVKGKTIGHAFVFCRTESLILETVPQQADVMIMHLDRYLIQEDVQLIDRTSDWGQLFVAGNEADSQLGHWLGIELPDAMLGHADHASGEAAIAVRRVPLSIQNAYLLSVPRNQVATRMKELVSIGAARCRPDALQILRIEAGMPAYGVDISDQNLPQEVHRDAAAISFTKGCYLGQETVARLDALGHVNRLLVGVQWQSDVLPTAGEELRYEGQPAGHVTSAVWSPNRQAPLALAYVRTPHHATGTPLESAAGPARVVDYGCSP
jgi:folate-binding protein YgfZ